MSTPGPRNEQGSAAGSRRHPPHVDENAEGAPVQGSSQAPNQVPTMPANAHGSDQVPVSEGPIDPESMYNRRPGEDKNRAETDMP